MSDNTNTPETPDTTAEQSPQLQIGDIEAAVKVIDYAAENGAFKGWQVMSEVLVLRNRLVQFVRAVQPQPVEAPEAETVEGTTAETAATEVPESPASTVAA